MSATLPSTLTDRRWRVAIVGLTFVASVINAGALIAYLLNMASPWLVGAAQVSLLIALVVGLRVLRKSSTRTGLGMWPIPLAIATVITLYLTLATPG